MNANIADIVNYTVYPLMAKGGLVQLVYRPGQFAFHTVLASNVESREWEAEELARPFLRLPFAASPAATSWPGCLALSDGALTLEVRRSPVLHTVHITVTAPVRVNLYCGPAGVFYRYGYTQGQDPSMFQSFPDEAVENGCWLTHRNEWTGALAVGPGEIAQWGIGATISLPAGRSVLAFGVGRTRKEAITRAKQVAATSADEAAQFIQRTWQSVLTKVPEAIQRLAPAVQAKALESIYLQLEDTRYEPVGAVKYPVPCAVATGYRTPCADWDNAFSAAAMAPFDLDYAMGIVLNFLDNAREDGSTPVGIEPSGVGGTIWKDSCKSLITAWAPWHIYNATGNPAVLDAFLPGVLRSGHFLQKHLATYPDGLPRVSSINDNTPSDDRGVIISPPKQSVNPPRPHVDQLTTGGEIVGIMLTALVATARLCRAAGRNTESDSFLGSARGLATAARKQLWDPQRKDLLYRYLEQSVFANNCERFLGAAAMPTPDVTETMRRQLCPNSPLWPRYGLATTGTDDPAFDPNQLWRGPIWIGTNYLVAEATAAMGLESVAEAISQMTQELVARNSGFWECHNPLTGQGHRTQLTMGLNASAFLMFVLGMHRASGWVRPDEIN